MQELQVRSLGWEDLLEKERTTHSSILAWKVPRTEELGGLQPLGSQKSQTCLSNYTAFIYIYILISEAIFLVIFLHYVKGLEILYLIVCSGNWEELAIFLHFRVKNKKEKMFRKKGETGSDECLLYAAVPSCKMECVVVQEALKKQHTPITQELKQWASRLSGKQITSRCTLSSSSAENTEYMCRNRPHLFLLCVALTFC